MFIPTVLKTSCLFFFSWLYNLFDSYVDKKIKETLQDKVKYSGSDGLCQLKSIT